MKYFLYCRKSTDREDKQILSTEAQQRILLEHAERNRLPVAGVFVENQSAYKAGRPRFNEMLARLERKEADAILTYHLTRLARNSYDGGRLIYMMDEGAVRQIDTPEKAYLDSPDDKFMMQIHFAMAKKSSDDTSQFVTRDIESKLLRGEYPGKAPLGYLNITRDGHIARNQDDPEKYMRLLALGRPLRRVEIDPIDGLIVRRLFEEAARGVMRLPQLRRLAIRLGLRAQRSGGYPSKSRIEAVLKNPFYYGVLPYAGRVYDTETIREKSGNPAAAVQHEPLISRALFDRVQETMCTRRASRQRKHAFTFGRCLLRCGECGASITAERQKGHVYYHCTRTRGPCSQRGYVREEVIGDQIAHLLINLHLPQSFLDYVMARLRLVHRAEADVSDALRVKLQGCLNAAQRKLDALLQMKLSPANAGGELLSDEEYLRQKGAIRRELEEVKEQLAAVQERGETWVDDCERFFHFTQRLVRGFDRASPDDKKALLLLVCSNLTLQGGKVAAVYQEPYATLAGFPLAGGSPSVKFEPEKARVFAENPEFAHKWRHLVDRIRMYRLPQWASSLAERWAEGDGLPEGAIVAS